jgi:polysaccharide chain length determinant protein (PEP-CTERM system associated)
VAWLLVWLAGWVIPARYTSTTTILVERPSVPKDFVTPNVGQDLQGRLQSITQQILSRTRLLTIINRQHLYERHGQIGADAKVDLMRQDIDVQVVRSDNQKELTGFTVAFTAVNPQLAQQVTTELTDLFIDENVRTRQQESQGTTKFLQSQLDSLSATLAEQEAKLREYKARHEGELPSQQASNIQILSGLETQLKGEQDGLNNAKQQTIYMKSLSEDYRMLPVASDAGDDSQASGIVAVEHDLEQLRARLANLSSHYTDGYPDVQNLRREIAKMEARRTELLAGIGVAESQVTSGEKDTEPHPRNPKLMQIESQLKANQAEITNREGAIATLTSRIAIYQARLNIAPVREQELADLTRGYEQMKATYDDLMRKKNLSEMATNMEQMQQGERFRIIDPPGLPTSPVWPNRPKLCGIGLAVGLALGLVVVFSSEVSQDRLHSEKQLKALVPAPVLSEVPDIMTAADLHRKKRRTVLGWATAALIFTVIAVGSALTIVYGQVAKNV